MKFLTDHNDIQQWLQHNAFGDGKSNIEFTPEGVVAYGSLTIYHSKIEQLPVKFASVNGDFTLHGCVQLRTLAGCPQQVNGKFSVISAPLTVLTGGPDRARSYEVHNTQITDLTGGPTVVELLQLSGRSLLSLHGAPDSVAVLDLSDVSIPNLNSGPTQAREVKLINCKLLQSLSGCPVTEGLDITITYAYKLEDLRGIGPAIRQLNCSNSGLLRLEGIGRADNLQLSLCGRLRTLQHLQYPVQEVYAKGCHQLKVDHLVPISKLTVEHLELPPVQTLQLLLQTKTELIVTRKNRLYQNYKNFMATGDYVAFLTQLQRWPKYHELGRIGTPQEPQETFTL